MDILIGIPTTKSSSHIFNSLELIFKEVALCPKIWNTYLAVCINGFDENHETENEVRKFLECHKNIHGHVLVEKNEGKNNAMNQIIAFARNLKHVDVVHFFDDDVSLERGTFVVNINTLIKHEKETRKAALVGSAFIGIKHPFEFFLRRYAFFKAVRRWIFHTIIIQPYLMEAERPKFCEGPSFCCYLKYLPTLPDDATGITDDAFLSNWFAINGKEDYEKNGILSIIKPADSISYIRVPLDFDEWKGQQIRVHAGIERAFSYFDLERNFLEKYFSWTYAFNKKSRIRLRTKSLAKMIMYVTYMYLHEKNRKEAECLMKNDQIPDWAMAYSTKE